MFELILYAIGFFLITLLFQYLLHRFRKMETGDREQFGLEEVQQ